MNEFYKVLLLKFRLEPFLEWFVEQFRTSFTSLVITVYHKLMVSHVSLSSSPPTDGVYVT